MDRLKHVPFTVTWYGIWSAAGSNRLVRKLTSLQMLNLCCEKPVRSACDE